MTPQEFLERLDRAGISVTVKGDQLVLRPRDLVTRDIADAVRAAKPELMQHLTTWDEDHADKAIAAMLRRIAERYRRATPVASIWDDDTLADLEERVNVAAQAHDRVAFDEALRAYEAHVLARYGAARVAGTAA